jgi:hypothetical protein
MPDVGATEELGAMEAFQVEALAAAASAVVAPSAAGQVETAAEVVRIPHR